MNQPSYMEWRKSWNKQIIFLLHLPICLALNWMCHTIAQPLPQSKSQLAYSSGAAKRKMCSSLSLNLIFFGFFFMSVSWVERESVSENTRARVGYIKFACDFRTTPFYKLAMLIPSKLFHFHQFLHHFYRLDGGAILCIAHSLVLGVARAFNVLFSSAPRGNVSAKLVPFFEMWKCRASRIGNVAFDVIGYEIYVLLPVINFYFRYDVFYNLRFTLSFAHCWHSPLLFLCHLAYAFPMWFLLLLHTHSFVVLCDLIRCLHSSLDMESYDTVQFDDAWHFGFSAFSCLWLCAS